MSTIDHRRRRHRRPGRGTRPFDPSDPKRRFRLRAVTRKPDSVAARALATVGAEIASSISMMPPACARRWPVRPAPISSPTSGSTTPEKELAQAQVDGYGARAMPGSKHVIWSTLEDTREFFAPGARMPVLIGKYNVPHYDAKGEANRAFFELGVPVTLLYTSFFWDNLVHFGMQPQRGVDGQLAFVLPMGHARLPGIAAADVGPCAHGILARGEEMIGKSIGIAGELLTGAQMAEQLTLALGESVAHVDLTPSQYAALGFPGADDLANMFQFKTEFERQYCASRRPSLRARVASGTSDIRALAGGERRTHSHRAARGRLTSRWHASEATNAFAAHHHGRDHETTPCSRTRVVRDRRGDLAPPPTPAAAARAPARDRPVRRRAQTRAVAAGILHVRAAVPAVVRRRAQAALDPPAAGRVDRRVATRRLAVPGGHAAVEGVRFGRRVETRFIERRRRRWRFAAYVWNDDETDAPLAPAQGVLRRRREPRRRGRHDDPGAERLPRLPRGRRSPCSGSARCSSPPTATRSRRTPNRAPEGALDLRDARRRGPAARPAGRAASAPPRIAAPRPARAPRSATCTPTAAPVTPRRGALTGLELVLVGPARRAPPARAASPLGQSSRSVRGRDASNASPAGPTPAS